MEQQRALILGGAGFIGSHIADQLVRRGMREITIFDNFVRGRAENLAWARAHGSIKVIEGDIRDRGRLGEAMQGVDVVYHQAAIRITQCAEEPRLALEVLVDGTFNVLEEAVKAKVGKVVAASSASVYGMASSFPTREDHPPYENRTLYGAAKAFNEGLLRSFHEMYGLDYVALRYFNVFGPRMDTHGAYTEVLVRWMERIARGEPPLILGTGDQTMDFVFVEDVARGNLMASEAAVTDEVFNIATGVETSLKDLAHALLKVMGSDLQPTHAAPRTVNAVARRLADVGKARSRLGFEARVTLEEGLRRLVSWWKEQRVPA